MAASFRILYYNIFRNVNILYINHRWDFFIDIYLNGRFPVKAEYRLSRPPRRYRYRFRAIGPKSHYRNELFLFRAVYYSFLPLFIRQVLFAPKDRFRRPKFVRVIPLNFSRYPRFFTLNLPSFYGVPGILY